MGNMFLQGTLTQSASMPGSVSANSFVITDSADSIVGYINSRGSMLLQGTVTTSASMPSTISVNSFVITNSTD